MLALIAAAGAVYLLVSSREPSREPVGEGTPAHPEIDSESRAKLREVLREERGK
jgi:hypothetical protein